METAQDVYGMSEDQHGHKKTWWNEEVAEGLREKKTSMEIGREKTQKRCGRSTRRVDKMQRELFLQHTHTHTHTRLTALCPGLPGWAGTRKVKPIWILLKQETVGGSGISWTICKSALHSRQITTPAPHHSVFYRPDALPATQPTASKHWKHWIDQYTTINQSMNQPVEYNVPHNTQPHNH